VLNLGMTLPELDGVKALAPSPILREVRRLILYSNRLSGGHLRALLRSPHLGPLTALDLKDNWIDVKAIRALAESPALAGLRALNLTTLAIDEARARILMASPHLNRLALLWPTIPDLRDPAHESLTERFGKDVRHLVFEDRQYRGDE
jgi:hypothetical protein